MPRLDALEDDRWLTLIAREQLGNEYHQEMLLAFSHRRDYTYALAQARHLSKEAFKGFGYQRRAIEVARQLERRGGDFKTFRLPGLAEWKAMRATMTRSAQVRYLADRLRLLNCIRLPRRPSRRGSSEDASTHPAKRRTDPVLRSVSNMDEHARVLTEALRLLAARCPRLIRSCYWAGTSSVAIEELGHRDSYDLDFHTRRALLNVRPLLAEIRLAFPGAFQVVQLPDALGSGFSGVLTLPTGERVTVEVLSNYESVPARDLAPSTKVPGLKRVSLSRYLADKVQCIAERTEARDLVDIHAVLSRHPELVKTARLAVLAQDALLLAERLTGWTEDSLERDLQAYPDVDPNHAIQARDLLLSWLRGMEADR